MAEHDPLNSPLTIALPGRRPRRASPARPSRGSAPGAGTQVTLALPDVEPASTPPAPGVVLPERYEDRGLLGLGGMGEVRRAWDRQLERYVAIKVLKPELDGGTMRERFLAEARLTARLEHPGIVAVHDQGELPDGRVWFAMRVVQGRTWHELIRAVHAASKGVGAWRATADGWSFRRLVTVFESVCETLAFAHAAGVVHRDIKPRNVMVGEFGEVQVMDWGLARRVGAEGREGIAGTPGYMSPEQIRRDPDQLRPTADVFSLGAVLYELLTGVPPYPGGQDGLRATLRGPPLPPEARVRIDHPPLAEELCQLAVACLEPEPAARPSDARALARRVLEWLDGARRRELAVERVRTADAQRPLGDALRMEAQLEREAGRSLLAAIPPSAPEAQKWTGWALEDRASTLEREADLADLAYVQALRGALEIDPTAPEPHERLADFYRDLVATAEAAQDLPTAEQATALLRQHDRGRHAAFLAGDGAVTIVTDPPGATVELYRYEEQNRALVAVRVRSLGVTPVRGAQVPRGSYRVVLRLPGHRDVVYPFTVGRQEHWDGVPPGAFEPTPIVLPRLDELGEDDCYVPAGWFRSGGDREATDATESRRHWLDAFVIRRFPVTCAEYLTFLDAVAEREGVEATQALLPVPPMDGPARGPVRWVDGAHRLAEDSAGRHWQRDWPISCVSWHNARRLGEWEAGRSGLPWRLPHHLEREKAGRGTDARRYPWGNHADPSRSCTTRGHASTPMWGAVTGWTQDVSPYGVRGLAGNVRDWCMDAWGRGGEPRASFPLLWAEPGDTWVYVRGGAWMATEAHALLAGRYVARPTDRLTNVGIRLARPLR